jgi:opacity protein-like surface antigen
MRVAKWFVVAAMVLAAVPAFAQVDEKKVNVNFGGGYTFTLNGDARERIGDGFNFAAGLTFNVQPKFGIQVEWSYTGLGEKQIFLPVSPAPVPGATDEPFFGQADMQYLDVNLVVKPMAGQGKAASPYFLGGFGYYYRNIDVTTPGVGWVPGYCDPWWYVCYPGGFVPVENIVGQRNSNDFGINFGAGVDVKLGDSAALYFEARYHYIWGPEIVDNAGTSYGKANGQFLPFTVGIRF